MTGKMPKSKTPKYSNFEKVPEPRKRQMMEEFLLLSDLGQWAFFAIHQIYLPWAELFALDSPIQREILVI